MFDIIDWVNQNAYSDWQCNMCGGSWGDNPWCAWCVEKHKGPKEVETILNLTPHEILIYRDGRDPLLLPPFDPPARVEISREVVAVGFRGIPIQRTEFGEIFNLPELKEGTVYVVSYMVANAIKHTGRVGVDIFFPGPAVRDHEGKIIACNGLSIL